MIPQPIEWLGGKMYKTSDGWIFEYPTSGKMMCFYIHATWWNVLKTAEQTDAGWIIEYRNGKTEFVQH